MRLAAAILALMAVSCDAPPDVAAAPQGNPSSPDAPTGVQHEQSSGQMREGKIWRGTIADLPITACFYDEESNEGAYYYDKILTPLRLVEMDENAPATLTEVEGFNTQNGATWSVDIKTEDELAGTWRKGTQELEIILEASVIQLSEYGGGCESVEFVEPLVKGGVVKESKASFQGISFTKIEYAGPKRPGVEYYTFSSLQVFKARPGDEAINQTLSAFLPDGSETDSMLGCVGMSIGSGQLGYWEETAEPTVLTPDWLGISRSGSQFCGGAHPNHFLWLAVYDRQSGKEVDASTWFKDGALTFYDFEDELGRVEKRPVEGASEKLLDAIIANWPDDPGVGDDPTCADRQFLRSGWQLGLSQKGVIFVHEFPHVVFACTAQVVVPWDQLEPFLSDEGLRVRDSLE